MPNRGQWIKQKRRTKLEDTKPEIQYEAFCKWADLDCSKPRQVAEFRPDRETSGIYVWIDGPYHWSDRKRHNDDWAVKEVFSLTGKRSIRIDSPLVEPRYWEWLKKQLLEFMASQEPWKRLWQ